MLDIYVHPHALKHGLDEDEILYAWSNYIKSQQRSTPHEEEIVRVGYGKLTPSAIQMIGVQSTYGILIIHAMTPPPSSVLDELGIPRR